MKNKLTLLGLLLWIAQPLFSQSYTAMEDRFNRSELSSLDSTAFINLGEQKAKSLFALTDLYLTNRSNTSNQQYIQVGVAELFYVEEGDTLDVEQITQEILKAEIDGAKVLFHLSKAPGYLGKLTTINSDPEYEFYLILRKVKKNFGDQEEEIWQVFLTKPRKID